VRAEKAFGEDIPFKNRMFGGAFILFTLCFAARPEAMVSEAARVLKPGGGLILGIINKTSSWGKFYEQKKTEEHPIYKYATFYSIEEAEKMIVMAGLQIASYSSTLYQSPTGPHYRETSTYEKGQDAGFVCILANKP
ncbi:MAG: methyltransferase domain-containing protein, partial [Nitrospirota bacterium]|nr:methyltransferase domain-containing protein [Nitrospirota bacterium]